MLPPVEAMLRRHRALTIAALAVLVLLAWAWLASGAGMDMAPAHPGGAMAGMAMDHGMAMEGTPAPWPAARFLLTLSMWWVMMVAMMLPSAAPTILLYARTASQAQAEAPPATGSFLAGYLMAWAGFSLVATLLHLRLETAGLLEPMAMASQSRSLSAAVLVLAGVYQLSPLKDLCLRQCRSPGQFLARHYRPGRFGALRMGLLHGAWCVACCWPLMLLLFVGGVMNLAWIAALTLLVAAEKLLPYGRQVSTAGGIACLVGGAVLLFA